MAERKPFLLRVDPAHQEIRLDGELLKVQRHVYYLVNKPVGLVSTNDDPSGRPRVIDLIPESGERLFTVGRLDLASEGLMPALNPIHHYWYMLLTPCLLLSVTLLNLNFLGDGLRDAG